MILRSNSGFMIIQTLVASALLGILGLAFAGLMKDMWTESQSLQGKSNEMSLSQALRQQVSTTNLCNSSFDIGNRSFTYTPNSTRNISIRLDPAQASSTVTAGSNLPTWGLTVNTLRLQDVTMAMTSIGGETLYVGRMTLEATANNGRKMKYKEKELGKLFFKVQDATNTITGCFAENSSAGVADTACTSLGGVLNPTTGVCDLSGLKERVLASVGQCPSGQTMMGFDANGNLVCAAAQPAAPSGPSPAQVLASIGQCPSGQMMMGFDANGGRVCATAPTGGGSSTPSNYQCRGTVTLGCTSFGAGSYNSRPLTANCCPANKISCSKTAGARTGGSCGPHGDSQNVYQDYICTCGGV